MRTDSAQGDTRGAGVRARRPHERVSLSIPSEMHSASQWVRKAIQTGRFAAREE